MIEPDRVFAAARRNLLSGPIWTGHSEPTVVEVVNDPQSGCELRIVITYQLRGARATYVCALDDETDRLVGLDVEEAALAVATTVREEILEQVATDGWPRDAG
ncbi:MAG: hypothetical protein ACJ72D_01225 [Marmoricola sp.]